MGYPGVLVHLEAIDLEELRERIEDAWLIQAPKTLAKQLASRELRRQVALAVALEERIARVRRVRLARLRRLLLDARAVLRRDLVDGVEDLASAVRAPTVTITHGPSPAPTNTCFVHGGQWTKSHAFKLPLLALDHEDALAGDDEEVLLADLAVVHAGRLAGLEHGDPDAELLEVAVAFEIRPAAEPSRSHQRASRALRTNQPGPSAPRPSGSVSSFASGTISGSRQGPRGTGCARAREARVRLVGLGVSCSTLAACFVAGSFTG